MVDFIINAIEKTGAVFIPLMGCVKQSCGQQLFVGQHSAVKIKISSDFLNAIRAFQRENIGHEKRCPNLA
ncbi:MAG: hypothetical protein WCS87_08625 [Methylococcaceae bacterium]